MDFTDVPTQDLVDIYMSLTYFALNDGAGQSETGERCTNIANHIAHVLAHRQRVGEADVLAMVNDWGER